MLFNSQIYTNYNQEGLIVGAEEAPYSSSVDTMTAPDVPSFDDFSPYNPNKDYEEMMQWIKDNIDSRKGKTEMEGGVNLWMLMYIVSMMSDFTASRVARTGAIAEDINDIKNLMNQVNTDLNAGRSNLREFDTEKVYTVKIDGRDIKVQLNSDGTLHFDGLSDDSHPPVAIVDQYMYYRDPQTAKKYHVLTSKGNPPHLYYINDDNRLVSMRTADKPSENLYFGTTTLYRAYYDQEKSSWYFVNDEPHISDDHRRVDIPHNEQTIANIDIAKDTYTYVIINGEKYYTSAPPTNPKEGEFLYGKKLLRDKLLGDIQEVKNRLGNNPYFAENPDAKDSVINHLDSFERTILGTWSEGENKWIGGYEGNIQKFWEAADPQYFDPESTEQGKPGDLQAVTQAMESVQKQFQAGDSIQQTIIKSQSSLYDTIMGTMNTVNKAMDGMHRTMNQHMGSGT